MVMNMNLSEYMRTKEIINFLFGCTNSSVKAQNELKNMDFVAIKKLDDNLEDINSKSLYFLKVDFSGSISFLHFYSISKRVDVFAG